MGFYLCYVECGKNDDVISGFHPREGIGRKVISKA